jgi:hypothetical protein
MYYYAEMVQFHRFRKEITMKGLEVTFITLLLAAVAAAGEWHVETVDPDWGIEPSLALDSSGYPHIAYRGTGASCLKYARWDGDEWQIETVDTISDMGVGASLALDSSDFPHISFYDGDDNTLKYAHWDGADWQIETVDSVSDESMWTSLALDSDEYPHIAYVDYTNHHPMYAHWNGATWQHETIDPGGWMGANISLALDSSDHPHVTYSFDDPPRFKYAVKDGTWEIETLLSTGVDFTSLALDSSEYPHISYYVFNTDDLRYAQWNGSSWQFQIVDEDGDVGRYTSLGLDASDYPNISYYDALNEDLKYARWDGDSWQIYTVDWNGEIAEYGTSLALDSIGNPHIAYYDDTNGVIKYAHWEGGPGVEGAEVSASINDGGVLVGWEVVGDAPAGLRVLRSVDDGEPETVSGALPGSAVRWLDTDAYEASDKGLNPLVYWLEVTDEDGTVSRFGPSEAVTFTGGARELSLDVYPSPAIDSLTIEYTLPEEGRVTVVLYDLAGRRVDTLVDEETTAGRHGYVYDASVLPPGVYLARLVTETAPLTRRLVITR